MKRTLPYLLLPVILVYVISCPGDYDGPPSTDTAVQPKYDGLYWPPPDSPQFPTPDTQYQWPDITPPQQDSYQWPDVYTGSPFGCKTDSDCFGLKCCSTPWGVKLCAEVCEP